ncbi:hypothetical protein NST38_31130 [Paenibacillus sp. FSL H8-0104]|uniref:hypothetical protein n=1 Tax=Paenibacillus sp. FSL H8-0104 TaxID=2954509 RepID=UPI0030FD99E5
MAFKFQKRNAQKFVKELLQQQPTLVLIQRLNFAISFSFSFSAKKMFENNPHEWYELGPGSLMITFALLISLMNTYIVFTLNFLDVLRGDVFRGRFAKLKVTILLGRYVTPFVFPIYSLVIHPELYSFPLFAMVIIFTTNLFKPTRTSQA